MPIGGSKGVASAAPAYREVRLGGALRSVTEHGSGGIVRMRSVEPLLPPALRLTDRLELHAQQTPDRVLVGKRGID